MKQEIKTIFKARDNTAPVFNNILGKFPAVKIKSWYPAFIVGWLVGRAIKKDQKKERKALNKIINDWESRAWRYDE